MKIRFLLPLLLILAGCGYRFLSGSLNLPPNVHKIAVPIFANHTNEPDLEKVITKALIHRIQQQGELEVTSESQADVILMGTVTDYSSHTALAYDKEQRIKEYRLRLTAVAYLKDAKTGKLLGRAHRVPAKSEYPVSLDVGITREAEKAAQKVAADEWARDLLTLWEGF